jgi:hypothetical protein
VTLKAAASAIIDDLVESGSFLRTQVSACDYGILDTAPASAVTLRPGLSSFSYIGYGGVSEDTWGVLVQGWVKDTGSVTETLGRVIDMHDALKGAVNGGSNANNATLTTRVQSFQHDPNTVWNFGGPDYFLVTANVTAREDPA